MKADRQIAEQATDWPRLLARGGRWSALVTPGSNPGKAAAHAVGLAFLAAPYPLEVQLRRAWQINRSTRLSVLAARELLRLRAAGVTAICPTLQLAEMCHAAPTVPQVEVDPLDADGWSAWAQPMLSACALVVVPDIQGWSRCPMVAAQVALALSRNMDVHVYGERPE